MARNHSSAKKAGTEFEKHVAEYLSQHLDDDRIERRARGGAKDRGDISGVRHMGARIVIECKNTTRHNIAGWLKEVEVERGNDDAPVGIVAAKRVGVGATRTGDQLVLMTLANLVALLTGTNPDDVGTPPPDVPPLSHAREGGEL